jgi:chromate reductase, NAD(P)H dehydrogenase (quinone)
MAVNVLGVVGSLRHDSYNRKLLRVAGSQLASDVRLTEYDQMKLIPPFDEDDEEVPPLAVTHWRGAVGGADAILFVTPEYNSSIPGQLKNAIDWASRPFSESVLRNKPVAVIGASTGSFGALWAQADLRKVLGAAGARVIDRELPVAAAHEAFLDDGTLIDEDLALQLEGVLAELVDATRRRLAA